MTNDPTRRRRQTARERDAAEIRELELEGARSRRALLERIAADPDGVSLVQLSHGASRITVTLDAARLVIDGLATRHPGPTCPAYRVTDAGRAWLEAAP